MNCLVLHVVLKQELLGRLYSNGKTEDRKLAWYAMRVCKYFIILVTSNLKISVQSFKLHQDQMMHLTHLSNQY